MYPTHLLTESEKKIRKCWLGLLLAKFVFDMTPDLYSFFSSIELKDFQMIPTLPCYFAYAAVLLGWLFVYLPYRCAYKKAGTKLLLFFTITSLIRPFTELLLKNEPSDTVYFAFFTLNTIISYVWAYYCLQLRTINKRVQDAVLYSSSEYASACTALQESESLEALNSNFQKIVQHRSKKFIAVMLRLYKKRKADLAAS